MQRKDVEELKRKYAKGIRLRMTKDMQDEYGQGIKKGIEGTVTGVDDIGNIHVHWDCGSGLAIIPEIDSFEVVRFDTANLGWRITEFGQMQEKADELIEYLAANGGEEGEDILNRMGGIKAQLEKELREVALWLIPAVKDNMMELRSDEQYADFLAEKFDEGEYQYVGATVIQLEKKANENA